MDSNPGSVIHQDNRPVIAGLSVKNELLKVTGLLWALLLGFLVFFKNPNSINLTNLKVLLCASSDISAFLDIIK